MAQRETDQQQQSLKIVLVGKTGVGKSSTGNTILGKDAFHKESSSKSVTKVCLKATNVVDGKRIEVVDTPGWCDTELSEAEIVQETVKCIDMSCPGPHVFLLVVPIGRFTEEERKTVKKIQEVFGEGALKYMMVLFTRGDDLERRSIEDFLKCAVDDLKNTVFRSCEGRYHVFNNKDNNHHQVSTLLQKIQDMVNCNGGSCYTNATYQLLETYKKRESELQQKILVVEKELKLKTDEFLKKEQLMQQEQKQQKEREAELKIETKRVLVGMLEQMGIEEQKRSRQAQQQQKRTFWEEVTKQALGQEKGEEEQAAHRRQMQIEEQKQKAEQERHRRRMEEEELKLRIAESQHHRRMNEERQKIEMTRVQMLRENQEEMRRLERQRKQAEADREEWLRREVKKKSGCSIS